MIIKTIFSVTASTKSYILGAVGAAVLSLITVSANAAVIWDYSPQTTGA